MKKIFILFCLLPFSLIAELYPEDLNYISGRLDAIFTSSSKIENDVDEIVNYTSLLSSRCYAIIQGQDATRTQVIEIKSLLTDLNYLVDSLKADINTYLPSLDSNLLDAVTSLGYCQNYLNDIKNTTSNIYDELSALGTISDDLSSIKILLDEKYSSIFIALNDINTATQNIYDELLSQGYDIKDIKDFLISGDNVLYNYTFTSNGGISNIFAPSYSNQKPSPLSMENWSITKVLIQGINYMRADFNKSHVLLANQTFRIYDLQTNFCSSIKLQKSIATNVAYIASVITNSHDLLKLIASNVVKIARHTMPTNVADQYETQQQEQIEQITSSYQEHENDMSDYESQLTHIPSKLQKPLDDGVDYISRLNSPSTFSVDTLDDDIYASFPDYHSSLAQKSFSLPIDIKLTPDVKQIFSIIRKCVTTTIWIFTFLFSLFVIQKFLQFVLWIMSLLQPTTCDVFGNVGSGSLYRMMGG